MTAIVESSIIPPSVNVEDTTRDYPFEESWPRGSFLWGNFKLIFFTITLIAPIRLILSVILCLLAILLGWIMNLGRPDLERPLSCWQKALSRLVVLSFRLMLFISGYYYIPVNGHIDPRARIVVMNHVSRFDTFYYQFIGLWSSWSRFSVSVLAKADLWSGIWAPNLKAFQCIPVDRGAKGRNRCVEMINERVANDKLPRLLIYPEGTTKAPRFLIKFKTGAFRGGHAVNPVVLSFLNSRSYGSQEFIGTFHDLYGPLCNFINFLRIDILPLYQPSAAEVKDPGLYAQNVRGAMFEELRKHLYDSALSQKSVDDAHMVLKFERFTRDLELNDQQMESFKHTLRDLFVEEIFKKTGFRRTEIAARLALYFELTLESTNSNLNIRIDDIVRISMLNKQQVIHLLRHINPKLEMDISPMDFLLLSSFVEGTNVSITTKETNQLKLIFNCVDRDQVGVLSIEDIMVFMRRSNHRLTREISFDDASSSVFEENLRVLLANVGKNKVNTDDFLMLVRSSEEVLQALLKEARNNLLEVLIQEAPVFAAENNIIDILVDR